MIPTHRGQLRNWLFAAFLKVSPCFQFGPEQQEAAKKFPLAFPLYLRHIKLILAVFGVEGHAAAHLDGLPVLGRKVQSIRALPEHDAADQCALIL